VKYAYPAVFTKEDDENLGTIYNVAFPDIPGCLTYGDSIPAAIEMAREALAGCLLVMQESKEAIPSASPVDTIHLEDGFISLVDLDMLEYRRKTETRAVKRTVSLPKWLDAMAQDAGVNFSQTIQDALKEQLGVQQ
jgi:predicted RNase H-like HicB family nuclease